MTPTRTLTLIVTASSLLGQLNACGSDGGDPSDIAADDAATASDSATASDTSSQAPCDPALQRGCPLATDNCTFTAGDDAPVCVPEGGVAYGQPCGADDACERGVCLSLNGTDFLCYQFCQTEAHCEGGGDCLTLTDTPYKVCRLGGIYDTCDLLQQDCASGKACYAVANEPLPVCLPEGDLPVGDECASAGACAAGNICINGRCKRLCDRQASAPCGQFVACSQWVGEAGYCDE